MKKALVLFDIQQTLMLVKSQQRLKKQTFSNEMQPDLKRDKYEYYFRPGRKEFHDFFFQNQQNSFYEIGIWSSCDRNSTQQLAKIYFERYYRNLLFVMATRRPEYEVSSQENSLNYDQPAMNVSRDISQLNVKFPDYEQNNIIIVSNFKNNIQSFQSNDIVIPPMNLNTDDISLTNIIKFLNGVRIYTQKENSMDIRPIINNKSFDILSERIRKNQQNYKEFY